MLAYFCGIQVLNFQYSLLKQFPEDALHCKNHEPKSCLQFISVALHVTLSFVTSEPSLYALFPNLKSSIIDPTIPHIFPQGYYNPNHCCWKFPSICSWQPLALVVAKCLQRTNMWIGILIVMWNQKQLHQNEWDVSSVKMRISPPIIGMVQIQYFYFSVSI